MTAHIVIVDRRADFRWDDAGHPVVTAREYLSRPDAFMSRYPRIINLCRDYEYMNFGYYCSLLAEARGERVIPSVATILDLSKKSIYGLALDELDELLEKIAKKPGPAPTPEGPFTIFCFFGFTEEERYQDLAQKIFDLFRCPLLKVELTPGAKWRVSSIRPVPVNEVKPEQDELFRRALNAYTRTVWRTPKSKTPPRYYMAILFNPQDTLGPSGIRTVQKFARIGEQMGLEVDIIDKKDYSRLAEYDALFIRETTALDHHTYRFAKKAEYENLIVIDDPNSILRCTNKVYLAELLRANRIPIPRTLVVDRVRMAEIEVEFGFPLVLKIPDGSFSRGVFKVENKQELKDVSTELFRRSELIIAQEFIPTSFDWRVGVLNGKPIFACQYFMSRNHWQVVRYTSGGRPREGDYKALPVEDAPPAVVETAVKAARLIGDGLYGVDLKDTDHGPVVIEINDNPSIDWGVEDGVLKDELYRIIVAEFIRRLDAQMEPFGPMAGAAHNGAQANGNGNGAGHGAGNGNGHGPSNGNGKSDEAPGLPDAEESSLAFEESPQGQSPD